MFRGGEGGSGTANASEASKANILTINRFQSVQKKNFFAIN
jgi:hypothetical protein